MQSVGLLGPSKPIRDECERIIYSIYSEVVKVSARRLKLEEKFLGMLYGDFFVEYKNNPDTSSQCSELFYKILVLRSINCRMNVQVRL